MITGITSPFALAACAVGMIGGSLLIYQTRTEGAKAMTTDDQRMRRRRWLIGIEVAGLVTFVVALAGLVVVIVIGWPWPLIAVVCAVAMRVGVEGILRPSPGEVDEPS